jgi:hypothetical protein
VKLGEGNVVVVSSCNGKSKGKGFPVQAWRPIGIREVVTIPT